MGRLMATRTRRRVYQTNHSPPSSGMAGIRLSGDGCWQ
ncbi:hypothetical protein BN1221_00999c [Brenneria goodwinii]|uniref:Uncharacterized protein n=1 Tax=Brenneria goodwinii TaxID=1109412 RepID=A0A0G4JRN7_9GAMM|nr:hypothetical protein BN1221_00999c [Brenneria goodwinii]